MELVELRMLVPRGHEAAIAAMVRSQTEAIIRAATGTEQQALLAARLEVAAVANEPIVLPATEADVALVEEKRAMPVDAAVEDVIAPY